MIIWKSNYFSNSGYNNQLRCELVSRRFQQNQQSEVLNYIVYGRYYGLPALCASRSISDMVIQCPAERVLVTLRPGEDPQEFLLEITNLQHSVNPIQHSANLILQSGNHIAIDVGLWIRFAPYSRNSSEYINSISCNYFLFRPCQDESNRHEVQELATSFTVIIVSSKSVLANENRTVIVGSGVIIAQQGDTYYVLTSEQVVSNIAEYEVFTPDKENYSVISIERLSNSDLAILEFKSETIYQVAAIGDTSRLTGGNAVYISGDLYLDETQIHQLAEGQLTDTAISSHRARLEYTNVTTRPMRGGPVLDDKGDLVGIHLNAGSGIPIYVFLQAAPSELLNIIKKNDYP